MDELFWSEVGDLGKVKGAEDVMLYDNAPGRFLGSMDNLRTYVVLVIFVVVCFCKMTGKIFPSVRLLK